MFYLDWQFFSCTPDKDICVFTMTDNSFLAHQIRISASSSWTYNSFLAHQIRIFACFTLTDNSFLALQILGYSCTLPGRIILISSMLSHPGTNENHVNSMHWLYRKSCIYVVKWCCFLQPITLKNDVSLCKLHVNIKNQTAVAGSVGFFIQWVEIL